MWFYDRSVQRDNAPLEATTGGAPLSYTEEEIMLEISKSLEEAVVKEVEANSFPPIPSLQNSLPVQKQVLSDIEKTRRLIICVTGLIVITLCVLAVTTSNWSLLGLTLVTYPLFKEIDYYFKK